jgi:alpha-beta hydrolase superfamily lysophospholipase
MNNSETERRIECEDGTPLRMRIVRAASPKGCVIVVHGLDDHLERYGAVSQFLQESGYDVVLYDQRGHGRSGGVRSHVGHFSQYVEDLERVREAAQPGRAAAPHLFAHSMGAVVALLAAMRHPQRWRSVIVQGFPAFPGRTIPKPLELLVRALRPLLFRLRAATGLEAGELSHDAAVAEAYRRDPLVEGNVTLGWGAEFLAALRELREGAAAITCPLLILHGGSDTIARPEGSRWLAQHAGAKDRKLVTYPGLKHELHNEPAEDRAPVFAEILAWLDRH